MVKVYLSRKGVPFAEHNVSLDDDATRYLMAEGYSSTPVTFIGDKRVVGYKPKDIDTALAALPA